MPTLRQVVTKTTGHYWLDPYLNVLAAQVTVLADREVAVGLRAQQMVASVQLIKALGGDWNLRQLPSPAELAAAPARGAAQPRR